MKRIFIVINLINFILGNALIALEYKKSYNPFSYPSIAFYPGYEGGSKVGGIFDFGNVDAINIGIQADFPLINKASDRGGFCLFLGPSMSLMAASSVQILSKQKNFSIIEFDASLKPLYSFKLSHGYLGPYAKLSSGLSVRMPAATGINLGILAGLQYYFNEVIGLFAEGGFIYHYLGSDKGLLGYSQMYNGALNLGLSFTF